ncbi:transporter [Nocardioides sp. IC4_145]|uniref:monovalent cation/H+ antiporter complex subunit F n=1 Tax=Nocardioides sp. IC4_145 TaxID=2714037 RepID=UPI00140E2AE6|nr:monovalent cation/H+ antiporter complex subunit F [Nocardioides sp. IC4_145]NHC22809.1 transporter [Nocardioides sp. IC4_145]
MTALAAIAIAVLVVSSVLGTVRIARGPDDATRAVVGDLLFFCAIAIFVVTGVLRETSVLFDVVLLGTLCGILATAAFSRMLTRGAR